MTTVNDESTTARSPGRRSSGRVNRLVVRVLGSALSPLLDGKVCAVRYRTAQRLVSFPVQYVRAGDRLLVVAGNPGSKLWWRHFRDGARTEVLLDGRWVPARGRLLGGSERAAAARTYRASFPRVPTTPDTPVVEFSTTVPAEPSLRGRRLVLSWFVIVTLAEFLGFIVPAVAGALTVDAPGAVVLPVLLAAGAIEGAMLGTGQALVLRRALPAVHAGRWVVATAAAASFAYFLGLAPSTWATRLRDWPPLILWPAGAILGLALLFSIGFAQWLVLRHHISRSARWIATTAGAWSLGLAVFLGVTMPLWQPGQSLASTVLIGVLGGLLMAATTAAVTAFALRGLPGLR